MTEALLEQRTSLHQQSFRRDALLSQLFVDEFVVQDQVWAPVAVRINFQFLEKRVNQAQTGGEHYFRLRRVVYRAVPLRESTRLVNSGVVASPTNIRPAVQAVTEVRVNVLVERDAL